METIYEYRLTLSDYQAVSMPAHSEILCLTSIADVPVIHARINTTAEPEKRYFRRYLTEEKVSEVTGTHLASFRTSFNIQTHHFFEVGEAEYIAYINRNK